MTPSDEDLETTEIYQETDALLESLWMDLTRFSYDLKIKKAREYLLFGVARRLSIIRINLTNILDIAYPRRTTPLDLLGESACLSMHLHSFFYHCYGALDNAAWSFAYEKGFLEEGCNWQDRKFEIGFYTKKEKFPNWIKEHHTPLSEVLNKQKMAYVDMKEIRDALAHRIPLYVPPSVITEQQRQEQIRLRKEADESDSTDRYIELQNKANSIGTFLPIFHVEGDLYPKYDLRSYPLKVAGHLLAILVEVKVELDKKPAP